MAALFTAGVAVRWGSAGGCVIDTPRPFYLTTRLALAQGGLRASIGGCSLKSGR